MQPNAALCELLGGEKVDKNTILDIVFDMYFKVTDPEERASMDREVSNHREAFSRARVDKAKFERAVRSDHIVLVKTVLRMTGCYFEISGLFSRRMTSVISQYIKVNQEISGRFTRRNAEYFVELNPRKAIELKDASGTNLLAFLLITAPDLVKRLVNENELVWNVDPVVGHGANLYTSTESINTMYELGYYSFAVSCVL
jgi:hypothetical protein